MIAQNFLVKSQLALSYAKAYAPISMFIRAICLFFWLSEFSIKFRIVVIPECNSIWNNTLEVHKITSLHTYVKTSRHSKYLVISKYSF